jgi:hypothetical protein
MLQQVVEGSWISMLTEQDIIIGNGVFCTVTRSNGGTKSSLNQQAAYVMLTCGWGCVQLDTILMSMPAGRL